MVLVISLIMLLLLTIIGVTGMQSTSLEEKMTSNMRDKNIAFQAAEIALRDAEIDILSPRISGIAGMDSLCTNGICYNGADLVNNIWEDTEKVANATTTATTVAGVAAQPRYLIEGIKRWPAGASSWKYYYSITVIAQGAQSATTSILQEVYAAP